MTACLRSICEGIELTVLISRVEHKDFFGEGGRGATKSLRFWHRTNLAEHSSAINTRGNAAAVLRQVRGRFFAGARRIFSS